MSSVVLKRLPRPDQAGSTARYRVQVGEGRAARVIGYIEEVGDRWRAFNTTRPKQQRIVYGEFVSCKLAIKALEDADAPSVPVRRAA